MGVDFIVLAHRNPAQVQRLLGRLSNVAGRVYLHVDHDEPDAFLRPGVELLPRHRCVWGRNIGIVAATLDGLRRFVTTADSSHVVLLSGQDYPLRTAHDTARFFATHIDASFIPSSPLPMSDWSQGGTDRYDRWWFSLGHRLLPIPPRRFARSFRHLPNGLIAHGGSTWWAMSRHCAKFTVDFVERRPDVVRFFRRAMHPDEMIFQTIVMSDEAIAETVHSESIHFIDWSERGAEHPRTLTIDDVPRMIASDKLFARKFDATIDGTVLDELDRRTGLG